MFTIEFDLDEFLITLLDDSAIYEDVSVFLYDDIVYIRQWDEDKQIHNVVQMSAKMFEELQQSMHKPEGAYFMDIVKNDQS